MITYRIYNSTSWLIFKISLSNSCEMLKKSRAYFIKDQRNLFIEEPTYRVYRFELNIYVYILQLFLSFVIALHIIFQHTGTNVWNAFYNQGKYSNEIEYVKNNVRTYCNHATRNDYVKKILLEIDDYKKYEIPRRFFISKLIIKVTSHNFQTNCLPLLYIIQCFVARNQIFSSKWKTDWQITGKHDLRAKSSSPFRQLRGASSHIPAPLSSASSSLYIYSSSAWALRLRVGGRIHARVQTRPRDKTDVSALDGIRSAQPVSISFSINPA